MIKCSQQTESLKEKFKDYFLIGATINQEDYQLIDKDEKILEIVSEDFNSLTPENSMKWMHSHPEYSNLHSQMLKNNRFCQRQQHVLIRLHIGLA